MEQYNDNNVFAKIINGSLPCKKVYEDSKYICFHDINPASKVHVLLVPKGKFVNFLDFCNKSTKEEVAEIFLKITEIASILEIEKAGFKTIFNTGKNGGQEVPHFHIHIIG
jgi:diadenosine tetraphosphate (Ap4A) HIT family hydrolase